MSSPADTAKKLAYDGLGRALGFVQDPKAAVHKGIDDAKKLPVKALTFGLVTVYKVRTKYSKPAETPAPAPKPVAVPTPDPVVNVDELPHPQVEFPVKKAAPAAAKKAPAKKAPAKKAPAAKKAAPAKKATPPSAS